jgi:hypothetical protein
LKTAVELAARIQALFRGRAESARVPEDESVSFAELVWAHHLRQQDVLAGQLNGPYEPEYRERLAAFKSTHGEIVESHWCRHEASAVVLTDRPRPRRLLNLWRRDSVLRLHTATDWRTEQSPEISALVHRCEAQAIRVGEVLRDSPERIALQWLFAATARLLAFVDLAPGARGPGRAKTEALVAEQRGELCQIDRYFRRAGENQARLVYFGGMVWGTIALCALIAACSLALWPLGFADTRDMNVQGMFVALSMGALGAIVSVMTRMATAGGFNVDQEVGRKPVRRLGSLRPWIGATFALALYFAYRSSLINVEGVEDSLFFVAAVSFIAGFSERRAKVMLNAAAAAAGLGDEAPASPSQS